MEKASRIMYKIANVFNWILLVCGVIMLIFGIVLMANPSMATSDGVTVEDVMTTGITLLVFGIWMIVMPIVFIILTRQAYKATSSQGWDILFIVLGVLGGDIFYTLGGIFGVVAKNQTTPQS